MFVVRTPTPAYNNALSKVQVACSLSPSLFVCVCIWLLLPLLFLKFDCFSPSWIYCLVDSLLDSSIWLPLSLLVILFGCFLPYWCFSLLVWLFSMMFHLFRVASLFVGSSIWLIYTHSLVVGPLCWLWYWLVWLNLLFQG